MYFRIVKQETLRAQQTSPDRGRTNGCVETRPMDILELLSKAKEEYHRVRLQIALSPDLLIFSLILNGWIG